MDDTTRRWFAMCGKKVRYNSKAEAVYARNKMSGKHAVKLNVYVCRYCGLYHVGRETRPDKIAPKRKKQRKARVPFM